MTEVELNQPLQPLELDGRYRGVLVVVTLCGDLLGTVELASPAGRLEPQQLARAIEQQLSSEIDRRLAAAGERFGGVALGGISADGLCAEREAFLARAPFVSVVICTRDRPDLLSSCLRHLGALEYPRFEIVVVDNAPSTDATREVVRAFQGPPAVRYEREDRPGVANARECGCRTATADIIAFIDDDMVPARGWLTETARGFEAAERVGSVNGTILPGQLETPNQLWFEQFAGWGKGFHDQTFSLQRPTPGDPLFPYTVGRYAGGGNFAVTREALVRTGGFDRALGTGTLAWGGEDLDIALKIIEAGFSIHYRPSAYVFHFHPRDWAGLRRRAFGYGAGLTAFYASTIRRNPRHASGMVRRLPRALGRAVDATPYGHQAVSGDYPRAVKIDQLRGMLYGPLGYVRSVARFRQ